MQTRPFEKGRSDVLWVARSNLEQASGWPSSCSTEAMTLAAMEVGWAYERQSMCGRMFRQVIETKKGL